MDVVHLEIHDPRWREALGRIRHDFYHFPEYVKLDGECNEAKPMAFLVSDGDKELFVPYLVRRCDVLFPGEAEASGVFDAISPYGYPGLVLSDAAKAARNLRRKRCAYWRRASANRAFCSAFFRMNPLLADGIRNLFPENYFGATSDTVAVDLSLDDTQLWKTHPRRPSVDDQQMQKAGFTRGTRRSGRIWKASWRFMRKRWIG